MDYVPACSPGVRLTATSSEWLQCHSMYMQMYGFFVNRPWTWTCHGVCGLCVQLLLDPAGEQSAAPAGSTPSPGARSPFLESDYTGAAGHQPPEQAYIWDSLGDDESRQRRLHTKYILSRHTPTPCSKTPHPRITMKPAASWRSTTKHKTEGMHALLSQQQQTNTQALEQN